ncbi:MAG: Flp family type IVb pilin [Alphaproteobacteria bacterium]|nr:Flp family type IVb pilin [Alphaproteobacteria bacterium]
MKKQAAVKAWIQAFFRQDRGTTVIEYGLIAAGISLAIMSVVFLFGGELSVTYEHMANRMSEISSWLGG